MHTAAIIGICIFILCGIIFCGILIDFCRTWWKIHKRERRTETNVHNPRLGYSRWDSVNEQFYRSEELSYSSPSDEKCSSASFVSTSVLQIHTPYSSKSYVSNLDRRFTQNPQFSYTSYSDISQQPPTHISHTSIPRTYSARPMNLRTNPPSSSTANVRDTSSPEVSRASHSHTIRSFLSHPIRAITSHSNRSAPHINRT